MPVVVLVSGTGSNLQALLDASADAAYGVRLVAVGADRPGTEGLRRAERAGIPTFVCRVEDHRTRADWDTVLTEAVAAHRPEMVVSAGFLNLVGPEFLERFGGRYLNTHNALLPSFPGLHGPRDALDYGVKVSGATVHLTPIEFDLLHRLASRPGVVHTREQLLFDVWGYRDGAGARTVDSHVGALRKKLGSELVRTVHGVGYAFEPTR